MIFPALWAWGARAQEIPTPTGPIEIEADQVVHDRARNLYQARGNVEIRMGAVRLKADAVDYDAATGTAEAKGHVELTDGDDLLRCDSMHVNLETQVGVVDHAQILTRGNFRITGERVEKLGPKTYRIHEGTFTTCGGESPDWILKAKRVDLTIEGYAVARHSLFEVKGVPVAYLPFGIYPVKTERQTGFLIPGFAHSGEYGPEVNLPFFWAMSQDKDATVYLNWLGDRGLKEGLEFRYALPRRSRGEATFYFIDDQVAEDNRWAFLFRHDQPELPLGIYAKGNVNLVSDNDYVFDFEEDFPGRALIDVRTERYLESTVFGGHTWPHLNLVGEFSYFDDLTVKDNDATLQRLPEITLAAFDQPLWNGPLYLGGESSYTHFWREEGVRGSRLDFFPQVSLPFRPLPWLKFLPVAGLRETLYWPDEETEETDDFESRTLPAFEASLSTTSSRIFEMPLLGWERVRHSIEPEIKYTYIPPVDQRDLPMFDERDLIPYTSLITYGVTNFVDGRIRTPSGSEIRRLLELELSQSYSAGDPIFPDEDHPERQLSNIRGELRLFPFPGFNLRSDAEYSLVRDGIVLWNGIARASDSKGNSMLVEYRNTEDKLEQMNLYGQVRLWEWVDLFASYRYDLFHDLRIETRGGLTYRASCWEVMFSVEDRNRSFDRTRDGEVKFNVSISLTGLGSLGTGTR